MLYYTIFVEFLTLVSIAASASGFSSLSYFPGGLHSPRYVFLVLIGTTVMVNLNRPLLARILPMHNRSLVVFRLYCCSQAETLVSWRHRHSRSRRYVCCPSRQSFHTRCVHEWQRKHKSKLKQHQFNQHRNRQPQGALQEPQSVAQRKRVFGIPRTSQ